MPTGGILAIRALAAIGVFYVGKPTVKVVKKVDHVVCRAVTLGHHCKPKPAR